MSVTTLLIDGQLSVVSDAGEAVAIGSDGSGNVQVTVDGVIDPNAGTIPASSVESMVVVGGDLGNVLDLSGVAASDYDYTDIDGNPVTIEVIGGNGDDAITGAVDLGVTVLGGDGDDTIVLTASDNLADAGDGNDLVTGGVGRDTLAGGDGNDTIDAGQGDDVVTGGDGDDTIIGGEGNDDLNSGDGADSVDGSEGNDSLNGESGNDTLIGGLGNDTIRGGDQSDEIYGDLSDPLSFSDGNDFVQGQGQNDTIVGGGGADSLHGGSGNDQISSAFPIPEAATPPAPQPPPVAPPAVGFGDAVDSGGGTDSGTSHDMTNGPGDASLLITVDAGGGFGTASGVGGDAGAEYDPVGPAPAPATTTFESFIYYRDNTASPTGSRDTLTNLGTNLTTIRGLPTEANSTFDIGSLNFALTQTVTPMLDTGGVQTGSLLTQTLRFTNTGTADLDFEFVRYIDGDLDFDGTLIDGGGRFFTAVNDEVLFETDRGGSGSTDTTFLGITGKHGTIPTAGRFELDAYPGLRTEIAAGTALDDTVSGDNDGDQFVDVGQEYDITLALQNLFSLPPGGSDLYTTHTIFGSGAPNSVGAGVPPVANDDTGVIRANNTAIIDVVSNDSDADGVLDFASVTINSQPSNGTAVNMGDGRVSYTPDVGFSGTDLFVYTIADNDGQFSQPATVTITVTPPDAGDVLNGGSGQDTVIASDGDDRIFGGSGNDELDGSFGNDTIQGQNGNDTLTAGIGSDWLDGGSGNDFLDSRTLSSLSIDNELIDPEGDSGITQAIFTVTISSPVENTVTVGYGTSSDGTPEGGTAIGGSDYLPDSGTLTFLPGQTSQVIAIDVFGDTIDEAIHETFFVSLFNPVNATIFDGLGEGRIVDDDDPPPGGLVVTPTLDSVQLINALTGAGGTGLLVTGVNVQGHTLTSGEISAGTYTVGQAATYGLTRPGIVISNGDVADYSDGANTVLDNATDFGVPATAAQEVLLDPITGGMFDHNDVTQIDVFFDMLPGFDTLFFDVVFGSEEFPEFVGSIFIDGFGLYVNGVNIALVPPDVGLPVNIDHPGMAQVTGTELDGVLLSDTGEAVLQFKTNVGAGSTGNQVTFIVGDVVDNIYDTVAYISALGGSVPPIDTLPSPTPVPGQGIDDTLLGRNGNDTILAGEGADRISGGNGNDSASGGGGIDAIYGGGGADTLAGGVGDDTLDGQGGADTLHGEAGDDVLIWWHGGGSDDLHGDDGYDVVHARGDSGAQAFSVLPNANDLTLQTETRLQVSDGTHRANVEWSTEVLEFQPGDGDDTITVPDLLGVPSLLVRVAGENGNDVLDASGADPGEVRLIFDGGDGNDTITGSIGDDTINGGDGDDVVDAGSGNDTVFAGAGDDSVDGNSGDDQLHGEDGFDTVDGNSGDDVLFGGADRDLLVGGVGDDTATGGGGGDTLNGKSGDDSLMGGAGTDRMYGGTGDDVLDGGRDDDSIYGNNGNDRLLGDHGNDRLKAGNGDDTLVGGDGDDHMHGERGDDQMGGGDGNDTLIGARGDDTMFGGDGNDTLLAGAGADLVLGNLGDDYVKGQGGTRDTVAGGEGADLVFGLTSEIDETFQAPDALLIELDAV